MKLVRNCIFIIMAVFYCVNGWSQNYGIENADSLYRAFQIKSEYIYSFEFNKNKVKDSLIVKVNLFDSMGRLIKRFNFDDKIKDLIKSTEIYVYNSECNKLQKIITKDNILGFSKTKEYTYSKNCTLLETVTYSADKDSKGKFGKYEYDEHNHLKKVYEKTGISGSYFIKTQMQYQNELLEKTTEYDENGSSNYYTQYFYDKTGRLKRQYYYVNGLNGILTDFKYDDYGRCKERQVVFNIHGSNFIEQWQLDMTINTPVIEYYLYYPEGLCFERKFAVNYETTLIRAYYSTDYPEDLK
ncbi:MAG: hypothetical protein ABIO79_13650 [Ferruginibacter sp.]